MEYLRAISEFEGSWPMIISTLSMNIHKIDIEIQTRINRMNMKLQHKVYIYIKKF